MIDGEGNIHAMGSEVSTSAAPRFRVRGMGSVKQQPGCPDYADLIQDPWRVFECAPEQKNSTAEFADESFITGGREAAYYARVIPEVTPTIQGNPLGCEYDEDGVCIKTNICRGGRCRGRLPVTRRASGLVLTDICGTRKERDAMITLLCTA